MFPAVLSGLAHRDDITRLGDMDTEVFREFFQAFSQAAGITLHVETLYE